LQRVRIASGEGGLAVSGWLHVKGTGVAPVQEATSSNIIQWSSRRIGSTQRRSTVRRERLLETVLLATASIRANALEDTHSRRARISCERVRGVQELNNVDQHLTMGSESKEREQ